VLCSSFASQLKLARGHKIVASIAFRQLSPDKQKKVVALLKKHPRFEDDFAAKMRSATQSFIGSRFTEGRVPRSIQIVGRGERIAALAGLRCIVIEERRRR
jgi:hypothetical protein